MTEGGEHKKQATDQVKIQEWDVGEEGEGVRGEGGKVYESDYELPGKGSKQRSKVQGDLMKLCRILYDREEEMRCERRRN